MDEESTPNAPKIVLQPPTSLDIEALNSRLRQHNEEAAARSTRMIIDSASYVTTACSSPANESRDFFTSKVGLARTLDVAGQSDAHHVLVEQRGQQDSTLPKKHDHQAIVPPYVLQAISTSDKVELQARASASQTFASSKYAKDTCVVRAVSTHTTPLSPQNSGSGHSDGTP